MIKWCFCLLYRQHMSIYHLFIQDTMEDAQDNSMRHLPIITIPPQKKNVYWGKSRWLNSKTKIPIRWHRALRKKTALF
jgi:hypothetical protein